MGVVGVSRVDHIAGKRVVQALYKYEPSERGDLRFDEGDFMVVLAE